MTSEIRTNILKSRAGLSTVTMTDSGPMFSGITTFVDNSGFTFGVGAGSSIFTPASNTLTFGTNSNERFRIDSSGRLLLGTTTAGFSTADDLTIATSGSTGITIRTGTTNQGNIYFADGTSGASQYAGLISYNHNTNHMFFGTSDGTERLRIGSVGQIGIAGANYGTSGQVLTSGGSGATVSWSTVTSTTINNNADNRVITGSGSANTLEGEANLTFNGSTFQVTGEGYVTGNLSIGEATPDRKLHVKSGVNNTDGAFRVESSNGNIMDMGTDGTGHFLNCVNADPFRIKFANTERLRITSDGLLQLNNDAAKIQLGASQDLSIYHDGSSNRIIAANADLLLQSNNYSIRSENGSSTYLNIDSNGKVSISSGVYGGGGTVPELYVKGTSGRQMKIHNSNAGTSSLQITNATTGEGEDAGTQLFTQGSTGDFYISNQYASGDISFNTRPSGGSNAQRLTIDSNGNVKLGTSTPTAFTAGSPTSTQRFIGKKCMQGSVTSTVTLSGSGTGTFDLGKLWLTDDTSIELFIQVMRNDATNNQTHYCKAFIQKVKGQGMRQGEITHQNGEAYSGGSGFRVTGIGAGGYTAGGGSAHGTQIYVAGGAGGVIYRMTCFYTSISKNDMY